MSVLIPNMPWVRVTERLPRADEGFVREEGHPKIYLHVRRHGKFRPDWTGFHLAAGVWDDEEYLGNVVEWSPKPGATDCTDS